MSRKKTDGQFRKDAQLAHPDLYEYLEPYQTARTKMAIRCRRCGSLFKMTPNAHLYGQGCDHCRRRESREGVRYTQQELLSKMSELHGWRYGYDLGDYRSVDENITIICPEHGPYRATPSNHLRGKGCAKCGKYGFNPARPAYIYLLTAYFGDDPVIKIGITNKPRVRFLKNRLADGIDWQLVGLAWYSDGSLVKLLEAQMLAFFGKPFLGKERFICDHSFARQVFFEFNKYSAVALT
jgi:hypothetical protein